MKSYKPEQIRNVALIGHGTSGKTSLAEVMLFLAGASDRIGKVGDNSSLLDYDPDEVKRGLSINASLAFFEWQKTKINLLDTPGTNNFIGDTPGCIRVVDGGLLVVSAVEGFSFILKRFGNGRISGSCLKLCSSTRWITNRQISSRLWRGFRKIQCAPGPDANAGRFRRSVFGSGRSDSGKILCL